MADLYSVLPGITPTSQEILEAELLCKQVLEAKFPDLDLREGTALRDLVLRPNAMLFALCKKATDFYFSQHTIKGADDTTPGELVDNLLSNWFLQRNLGVRSIISARLYFARRKNVTVSSDVYFSTDNTSKFYPTEPITFPASAMSFDSFSNEYYVDVDLIAEKEGTNYNISSGSLLYFSNFDPYFLRAEINYLKSESIDSETNTQFISRAKDAISTRNLINIPSIAFNIGQNFNFVKRLQSIGMGDPEMVRDQIQAVFPNEQYRPAILKGSSDIINVNLPNHGYNTGQRVAISGAQPLIHNGEFYIQVIDASNFTFKAPYVTGITSSTATVKAVTTPVLLHNGGMVDVYCSDSLATALVQLTTNEFGIAEINGPIYELNRSEVSGGAEDDTIEMNDVYSVSSITTIGNVVSVITSKANPFKVGDKVNIAGALQNKQLISLTSSGLIATALAMNHSYQVGNTVIIEGVYPEEYNGTYTISEVTTNTFKFVLKNAILFAGSGTMYSRVELLNGEQTVTSVNGDTFTYAIIQPTNVDISGIVTAFVPVKYSITNKYSSGQNFIGITSSGTEVTVTLPNHSYTVGRYATITGSNVPEFNGSWKVTSVPNFNQYVFEIPNPVTASTTIGNSGSVIPWYDYGFSERQVLIVDFGPGQANKTVSFEIKYFQNLSSIQEYLDAPSTRVMCGDYLARGFNFYTIHVEVVSYSGTAPSSAAVSNIISSYLNDLEIGETFVMSDMLTKLRLNGITDIKTPPLVTYKRYTRDLGPAKTGIITDILNPQDRTSVFLLESVTTLAENINQ